MSKRVTRKSSIINRPTCGGPIKAGLGPRSTNFMFSMKPNHILKGKPFVDNKTSFNYECLNNENEQNFSNIIEQLNSEIQKTNNTLSLTLTEEIKQTKVTNMKDIRYLIDDAFNGYVITGTSYESSTILVTTKKSQPTEDTEDGFAERLIQFISILINAFLFSKEKGSMNDECSKQLDQKISDMNPKCPTSQGSGGMFDYYANLSKEPLDCFLGKKNLEKTENKFNSISDLKVGDIVFQWKKKSSENDTDYLLEVFAGILMYMQCSVYYHVGIVVEVPDNNWNGWKHGENPFTSKSAKSHTKIKVVWNATIGKDSVTSIGKDFGGAIFSTLEDFSENDYTSVRPIIYNNNDFKTHFNTRCGLIWDYTQSLNNGKGANYDLAFLSSWLDAETRNPHSLTCNLSSNNSNNSDDIMFRMKKENTCDCRIDDTALTPCDNNLCLCVDPDVCDDYEQCEDRFVTRRNQGCNFFCSGFVAFILKYASSSEFPLVEDPENTLCPHIIRPPDLSAYAADTTYNHYNDDILKQGYDYFKDSYEDEEYIYTNSEN